MSYEFLNFGNFYQFSPLNSKKSCQFNYFLYKSFLDFGRETKKSQFLNFSTLEGLVSYKTVTYKKRTRNKKIYFLFQYFL